VFDFSIGKIAILFALCLMVLGPEKLPKLAQQLGRLAGQARAMARHFRNQLEQEIAADELMKQKKDLEAAVQSSVDAAKSPVTEVTQAVDDMKQDAQSILDPLHEPGAANGSGHGEYDPANDPVNQPAQASTPISSSTPVVQNEMTAPETIELLRRDGRQ
jgi:sec-independent protein translocase protein TatB